jgi:hypothetical protein
MADNVNKIAAYCLQSAKIPADIFTSLMKNLTYNASISDKISKLEKDMEDMNKEDEKKEKGKGGQEVIEITKVSSRGDIKTREIERERGQEGGSLLTACEEYG